VDVSWQENLNRPPPPERIIQPSIAILAKEYVGKYGRNANNSSGKVLDQADDDDEGAG